MAGPASAEALRFHEYPATPSIFQKDEFGLRPSEMIIKTGRIIETLNEREIQFLTGLYMAGASVDYACVSPLEQNNHGLTLPEIAVVSDRDKALHDREGAKRHWDNHQELTMEIIISDEYVLPIMPQRGTYVMMHNLRAHGYPADWMVPGTFTTGTSLTQTGGHEAFSPFIPDRKRLEDIESFLRFPQAIALNKEDVIDSGNSGNRIMQWLFELREDWESAKGLEEVIKIIQKHRNYDDQENFRSFDSPELRPQYEKVAQFARKAKMPIAGLYFKNEVLHEELRKEANKAEEEGESWGIYQNKFLDAAAVIDHDFWIVGMGMDTEIPGSMIMESMRPDVKGYMKQMGMSYVSFRTLATLPLLG